MSDSKPTESKGKLPEPSPNDLVFEGLVLGVQSDNISYVSKKTNLQTEAKRDVVIIQTNFGIVLCRAFNPSVDLSFLQSGSRVRFAVNEYRIDNGVKTAQIKV